MPKRQSQVTGRPRLGGRAGVRRLASALALAAWLVLADALLPPAGTAAQVFGCQTGLDQTRVEMGTPDAQGVTQQAQLRDPSDSVGFHFTVPSVSATLLYVGDQWFDIDLYLYARGRCPPGGWETLIRAWSAHAERRVLQFMRPDEQIVNLRPGEYLMVASYKPPDGPLPADPFDPTRAFTARVALSPPYCAVAPPDVLVTNPAVPSMQLPKRPDDALYQLGLSIDPVAESDRGPFSLLTFSAFVSPPYTDLYDFAWVLDGKPVPDVNIATLQVPAAALGAPDARTQPPGGQHLVQVTARGVREYPDPALTHIPPTLSVQCPFKLAS